MSKDIHYSQNFLKDNKVIGKLLEKSNIGINDTVLDIGCGKGIITDVLKDKVKKVICIEKDIELYKALENKYEGMSNIEIFNTDIEEYELPNQNFKVFSNIPFNQTSNILNRLLLSENFLGGYIFLQKEAAYKYVGSPYSKETLQSVINKVGYSFEIVHTFENEDFSPKPNVDIVLLGIWQNTKRVLIGSNLSLYKDLVSYLFNNCNPSLRKGWTKLFNRSQIEKIGQESMSKKSPGEIPFEKYIEIFNIFLNTSDRKQRNVVKAYYDKLIKEKESIDKVYRTRNDLNWRDK
jgi:23S rRNA (adenine-N6)-dimethyltransferase